MKKVLVVTEKPFTASAVKGIKDIVDEAGYKLTVLEKYKSKAELLEAVATANAIIVRSDKIDAEVVDAAKELKIIVRAGAGYDNIDLEACTAKGIVVMNTPGQNANAVAELAIGLMIFMSRNKYNPGVGIELSGRTLGIQAYGYVGKLVAKKAKSLGMNVLVYDPFVSKDVMIETGVEVAQSLNQLYYSSDFVSLHMPVLPSTVHSIGYDLLSQLPVGACLINTARKEVINEPELLKVLSERVDLKYATDIAAGCQAELDQKFPDRVFATSKKMGAQTEEANNNAGLAAANGIVDYFKKGEAVFQVNIW